MNINLEHKLTILANMLAGVSVQICQDNGCTKDEHCCGSYAYLDVQRDEKEKIVDIDLCEVCAPDYAQRLYDCAIPLPCKIETAEEMLNEIENNLSDSY